MASIVIASKANYLYLAECEVLAEFLAQNLPNFKYTVIKKHKNEWDDFLVSLTESYGFKRKCCPIVFTVEGELIGDSTEFYDYAQNKYGKVYRVSKDTLDLRARNNAKAINEEVRRRDKGPNIVEKIQKCLRKAKKKQLVSNYEGHFKTVLAKGIPYKIRLTDITKRSVEHHEEEQPEAEGEGGYEEEYAEGDQEGDQEAEGERNDDKEQVSYFISNPMPLNNKAHIFLQSKL